MADQIRVLIVDDIPETRDHLTKLLGFEGDIEVVGAASSGAQALQLAVQLTPDVVLMDINMPDMDGITATERLAAEAPNTAVVMMSVQGEADYLHRAGLRPRAGEAEPARGCAGRVSGRLKRNGRRYGARRSSSGSLQPQG